MVAIFVRASAAWLLFARVAVADDLDITEQPFRVLVTGFGPFLGSTYNPTADVAQRLGSSACENITISLDPRHSRAPSRTCLRVCWHAHVLPVNRTGAVWTEQHLRSLATSSPDGRVPYDAVLHLGLEDAAKGLKLEVTAANIQAKDSGDDSKIIAIEGAPHIWPTTVNIGWVSLSEIARVAPAGALLPREAEFWSRDPGTFYCNEVYFRTLNYVRGERIEIRTGTLLPVMFIHMPESTESSILHDTEVVRQVAGHALWAAFLAPKLPGRLSFLGAAIKADSRWSAGPCAILVAFAVGASGATALAESRGRGCRRSPSGLTAPLQPEAA